MLMIEKQVRLVALRAELASKEERLAELRAEQVCMLTEYVLLEMECGSSSEVQGLFSWYCDARGIVGPGAERAMRLMHGVGDEEESCTDCLVRAFREAALAGDIAVAEMMAEFVRMCLPVVATMPCPGGFIAIPVAPAALSRDALLAHFTRVADQLL
jgi:hypothetical protein